MFEYDDDSGKELLFLNLMVVIGSGNFIFISDVDVINFKFKFF